MTTLLTPKCGILAAILPRCDVSGSHDMLSDVEFCGEYQRILHRATATGLKITSLSVTLPPLVVQAKTAASAHQEREKKSEQPFPRMPYAQRRTLSVYALLTSQGFFRAEVPASTLSVVLFACKTGEVKGQRDVFGLP